jgi:four helix bundle protein
MGRDYRKIKAWQFADRLAVDVYKTTAQFPKTEVWGLVSQMRRAAVSVPANIVEGSARRGESEYVRFLYIAISSLAELGYYIKFARDVGYLPAKLHAKLAAMQEETAKTLRGLINHIERSRVSGLQSNV